MATYKQPCLHCGEFIERDSRLCPKCHSRSPFGYHCPTCLKPIEKGQAVCSGFPLCELPRLQGADVCRGAVRSLRRGADDSLHKLPLR